MNGWVQSTAIDADIIFGKERDLCYSSTDGAMSLTSESMFRILCLLILVTGLRSAAYHLKSKSEQAQSAINDNSNIVTDSFTRTELLNDDILANSLMSFVYFHTLELDQSEFETDLV